MELSRFVRLVFLMGTLVRLEWLFISCVGKPSLWVGEDQVDVYIFKDPTRVTTEYHHHLLLLRMVLHGLWSRSYRRKRISASKM